MIIYKPVTLRYDAFRLMAWLLFFFSPFFTHAQEHEKVIYNISSDYDLLIKKIEKQTLKTETGRFDEVKTNIRFVREHKKIKVSLPPALQQDLKPEEIYKMRSRGVLMVGSFYDCGKCDKMHVAVNATAVVLNEDGVCMTNYHVLKSLGLGNETDTAAINKHMYISDIDGNIYPIREVLTYSRPGDLAIFKIDPRGIKLNPIPLGESAVVAANVHAITHPKGKELYYYSRGSVARNVSDSQQPFADRMDVSCEYAVGSSGGPILDDKGNLIGMVSTTRSFYASAKDPMTLQMVVRGTIPVKTIKRLL